MKPRWCWLWWHICPYSQLRQGDRELKWSLSYIGRFYLKKKIETICLPSWARGGRGPKITQKELGCSVTFCLALWRGCKLSVLHHDFTLSSLYCYHMLTSQQADSSFISCYLICKIKQIFFPFRSWSLLAVFSLSNFYEVPVDLGLRFCYHYEMNVLDSFIIKHRIIIEWEANPSREQWGPDSCTP